MVKNNKREREIEENEKNKKVKMDENLNEKKEESINKEQEKKENEIPYKDAWKKIDEKSLDKNLRVAEKLKKLIKFYIKQAITINSEGFNKLCLLSISEIRKHLGGSQSSITHMLNSKTAKALYDVNILKKILCFGDQKTNYSKELIIEAFGLLATYWPKDAQSLYLSNKHQDFINNELSKEQKNKLEGNLKKEPHCLSGILSDLHASTSRKNGWKPEEHFLFQACIKSNVNNTNTIAKYLRKANNIIYSRASKFKKQLENNPMLKQLTKKEKEILPFIELLNKNYFTNISEAWNIFSEYQGDTKKTTEDFKNEIPIYLDLINNGYFTTYKEAWNTFSECKKVNPEKTIDDFKENPINSTHPNFENLNKQVTDVKKIKENYSGNPEKLTEFIQQYLKDESHNNKTIEDLKKEISVFTILIEGKYFSTHEEAWNAFKNFQNTNPNKTIEDFEKETVNSNKKEQNSNNSNVENSNSLNTQSFFKTIPEEKEILEDKNDGEDLNKSNDDNTSNNELFRKKNNLDIYN